MKTDVIIVGSELDGLVAALRLLEAGHSVRLIAGGGGSLHYAPGGLHVLGFLGEDGQTEARVPLEALHELPGNHPYSRIGREAVSAAVHWLLDTADGLGLAFVRGERNLPSITALALSVPVLAPTRGQAVAETSWTGPVAIVRFRGHRDFPAALLKAALRRAGAATNLLEADAPGGALDNAGIAASFDRLVEPEDYFRQLAQRIPCGFALVLFPAVLGIEAHDRVLHAAETVLGCPCREVPTLPPSVPGLRLFRALIAAIRDAGGLVHIGQRLVAARTEGRRCLSVVDAAGREYQAAAFVHSAGGVLMGGLEVDSRGVIRDPVFSLPVYQTYPLDACASDALEALHGAGIEVDTSLRPLDGGEVALHNLFVTGRMLAHWNPAREGSTEGVSIASGWAAAESAKQMLRG